MLREIVLDTETTGTDHAKGDRVIEIGCVELLNHIQTGKSYHVYINPEFPVSPGAFAVQKVQHQPLRIAPVQSVKLRGRDGVRNRVCYTNHSNKCL